ncbi:hypothetical protein NNJEOMEG_00993 [Fundidesulfovibrio magnetotacticus]|uniref:Neuromedin U n=1 Tax=Fundidesulfovibrio magnetotacticus TaxID=2730080 RepID=A0A6V8LKB7_9BACT|nr:hypothetical protein [Fundidesulfovibrio magnetotacticus]GFK93162.1 hypothetical protein NNJEOMEG_00993 [Fundidesulfovibrio magnetotacticus]
MAKGIFLAVLLSLCILSASVSAQDRSKAPEGGRDLQALNQQASNPVGDLWMIANQFNFNLLQSDKVRAFRDPQLQFNWNFQPVLTFEPNDDFRLVARPVIPLYVSPYAGGRDRVDSVGGLGDAELMVMLTPGGSKSSGFIFGAGPTAIFPTATDKHLGNGKWQLGPAAAALYMNDKWVVGIFPQHWWSYAGDAKRKDVSLTKAQYFIWYSPAPTWQVGMSPNILVDWMQPKAQDRWTVPVGLGVSKMTMLGSLPVKFSVEADYSVVRPSNIPGNEWTFKFTVTPILPKLF